MELGLHSAFMQSKTEWEEQEKHPVFQLGSVSRSADLAVTPDK